MRRLIARTLASTCVESVRWRCRGLSHPCSLKTASMASNNTCSAPPSIKRWRKSDKMVKSKPGSVSSKPRAYARLDASVHRRSRLSIRQSLDELYYSHKCKPKGEPRQGVHSAEISGQRTRLDTSFPTHRAFSCRDCLWDRLHEPRGPFRAADRELTLRVEGHLLSPLFYYCSDSLFGFLS